MKPVIHKPIMGARGFFFTKSYIADRRLLETASAVGAFFLSFAAGVWFLETAPSVVIPQVALAKDVDKSQNKAHAPLLVGLGKARALAAQSAPVKLPGVAIASDVPLPPVRPDELRTAQTDAPVVGDIPLPPLRPAEYMIALRPQVAQTVDAPTPPMRPEGLGVPVKRIAALPPETPKADLKSSDSKAAENKPADGKPVEEKIAEPKPIEPPAPLTRRSVATRETTQIPSAPQQGEPSFFDRLFGRAETPASEPAGRRHSRRAMAYAAAPESGGYFGGTNVLQNASPNIGDDRYTAVYDISARTVYMPDGSRLEAHSGLREYLDDPHHVHLRMRGATPPNVYELKPRESLFHGVAALRLTPVAGHTYGRAGLLAHTYMLGPNGDSNGCVSFRDYRAFLRAYQNGEVRRLAVVAHR